ncbi:hypothetical protein FEE95_13515 [Maribacter algarum]|uniref:Uncharacterized protein n=1 Tax=Maribacter algarum (ex Zhang et al. 2020) TaxID=2578118 RepID=A0A5S3QIU6_9FLAO|nr:hypothetical protein [Maribacter algarum]TMM57495.1 hypothetical protein FEE95_13515 [Maribacter algarum]
MGYGQDAINVIKNNRSLLKRKKFKETKNLFIETSGKTELEFKEVSKEDLKTIKLKIRKQAKKRALIEIVIYGSLAIILLGLFAYFAFLVVSS